MSAPVTLSSNVAEQRLAELRLAMETENGSSEHSYPNDFTSWCPKCRLQSTMLEWCSHCNRCLLDGVSSSGYHTSNDSELQCDAQRSVVDSEPDSGLQPVAPESSADAESHSQWPDVESVSSSSGCESADHHNEVGAAPEHVGEALDVVVVPEHVGEATFPEHVDAVVVPCVRVRMSFHRT